MSYCRFSEGDVYAYECEGGVQFWTAKEGLNRLCNTFNEAYQYAMFLRDGYGLDVPSYAIEALKADALDEARRICGPDSAVAELEHENAKLRELIQKVWKWESNGCYECPLEKDCKVLCIYDGDCGMAVEIEKELQELGIEVDE